ncbi:MAG TPA: hypothetical protein VLG47_04565 [Candidatus Saccharimonadales bacterium]|nr:hypothetical protein [Candidatus Saccharimonadales bacterium]
MRKSSIANRHDSAGDYEEEIFESDKPERVIIGVHGGGVRRWDGEKFFYAIAEHYTDSAIMLVDQNQQSGEFIKNNPLSIAIERINNLVTEAKKNHPGVPIIIIAHSFGCGVASMVNLNDIQSLVLVTPTAGSSYQSYIERHGKEAENGLQVTTSDGLKKEYTAAFMQSIKGITWEDTYTKLTKGSVPVYVFEAGSDEIIGPERYVLRDIPFKEYLILDGAPHNLSGKYLDDFFAKLDPLLHLAIPVKAGIKSKKSSIV